MYETICIHSPDVAHQSNAIEIYTLSSIPEFLQDAITLENHRLWLDNVKGCKSAPLGSVICYEKSDQTASGYNCWSIGQVGINLIKVDGSFYTTPRIIHAMLIPSEDDAKPIWVNSCKLTYNGDGTATLKLEDRSVSGRIGIDFILCRGMKKDGKPNVSILATTDESYNGYIVCDDSGNDLGKLSELYPA